MMCLISQQARQAFYSASLNLAMLGPTLHIYNDFFMPLSRIAMVAKNCLLSDLPTNLSTADIAEKFQKMAENALNQITPSQQDELSAYNFFSRVVHSIPQPTEADLETSKSISSVAESISTFISDIFPATQKALSEAWQNCFSLTPPPPSQPPPSFIEIDPFDVLTEYAGMTYIVMFSGYQLCFTSVKFYQASKGLINRVKSLF